MYAYSAKFSLANYQGDYWNFMQGSLQQRDVFLPKAKTWEWTENWQPGKMPFFVLIFYNFSSEASFFFLFFILFLEIQISYLWHARHRPEKCWLHSDFPGSILAGSCMERLQSCTRVADCPCWLAMGDRQHLSAPAYWWHLKQKWISPKSLILSCLRRFEIWMWFHVWSKLLVSTGRAYSLRSGSQRADAEGREVMGRRFAQSLGSVCPISSET